jgi:hypothetical protein
MFLLTALWLQADPQAEIEWVGTSECRILVQVVPDASVGRPSDERPAQVAIDFDRLLRAEGIDRRADLSTLRVIRCDAKTGRPMAFNNYLYGQSEFDRPLQWYDDAIPEPFPDRDRSVKSPWVFRPGWGHYYEAIGDGRSGRLTWSHTQDGTTPSLYSVGFDLLGEGKNQTQPPPRAWIGDGGKRNAPVGTNSTGIYHVDCQMIDFNEDGLLDLVCGSSRGAILWYENLGTRQSPEFSIARLLNYSDGKPTDPGFLSTPTGVDWDGDGKRDLLVGASKGWVYFYHNVGSALEPRYEDRGPLQVDGAPLRMPASPVPEVEGPNGETIYKEDYEPFVEVTDWDADGDDDLLIGGYVTGRVFWYENTGRSDDGTPTLHFRDHLMADGKPLDVGWAANPAAADIDADGDLDLFVGVWRKWGNETPPEIAENFLTFYENTGTATAPVLTMKPLPRVGEFPNEIIASPTLADWDSDGDLDLTVSASSGAVYLFKNIGSVRKPKFDSRRPSPLQFPWSNDSLPYANAVEDWNGDQIPDLVLGQRVALGTTRKLPLKFGPMKSILPENQTIDHRAWRGDDWEYTVSVDFDRDGRKDILFGDYWGHIWFHRNISTDTIDSFDTTGIRIKTQHDQLVTVGSDPDKPYDFDTMQGPRTSLVAADFDGDGNVDIVVNDVFGHYYFCRRGNHGTEPMVESQQLLTNLGGYATTCVVDWDEDGLPDLLVSKLQEHLLFRNLGANGNGRQFSEAEKLDLPLVPVIGSVVRVAAFDATGDGDRDILITSDHGFDCLFERSFLTNGYAPATIIKFEYRRP